MYPKHNNKLIHLLRKRNLWKLMMRIFPDVSNGPENVLWNSFFRKRHPE